MVVGLVIVNRQREVSIDVASARRFVARLRVALRLGRREFNICFVTDREIQRLNTCYRRKARPTDVLSFPWQAVGEGAALPRATGGRPYQKKGGEDGRLGGRKTELANFLGDVVISAATARRNARREGHSTQNEIRWLILHGLLHLLGYDHETDKGEMTARELSWRERLGISGVKAAGRRRKAES